MMQIKANNLAYIPLGRQGENAARQIIFDISYWIQEFGAGIPQLIHQRYGDEHPYPVAIDVDEMYVLWSPTNTDTQFASDKGQCELRYYIGDILVKSKTWYTFVENAMDTTSDEEPPAPYQSWVDDVLQSGMDAQKSAQDAAETLSAAGNAAEAAKAAQSKAEDAQRGAEDAKTKAEVSKESSANSEYAAKLSEQNAKASEDAAKASETASAGSASAAARSAMAAQTAQSSAEAAQSAAEQSAQQAAEKAEDALTKAPKIGENGNWYIWDSTQGTYVDTGRYAGGIVPHIGDNGNWFIGTEDSGVPATGPQGEQGASGVYCGVEEPDAEYDVWVDPSGTPDLPGTGGFPVVEIENVITEKETPLTEAQNALISELIVNNMPFLLKLHLDFDDERMHICGITIIASIEIGEGTQIKLAALKVDTLTVRIMDGYIHVQSA